MNIYTDGSCTGNGYANARAGYGVYFQERPEWNISRRMRGTQTNNAAEMYAIYSALKRIYFHDTVPKRLHFYIDNKIALDTLLSNRKAGANWEIIQKVYKARDILIRDGYTITGEWVKGHSGNPGNEKADKLATSGGLKN